MRERGTAAGRLAGVAVTKLRRCIPLRPSMVAAAVLVLAGCQSVVIVDNKPLPTDAAGRPVYTGGYRLSEMLADPNGQILTVLAFSGGGKRSAALAHGALRGLARIPVVDSGRQRTLLDEVDFIAAVSGGSFPAAHYGLYRERSFDTFEHDFLKRDIEAFIWGTFLLPWNWEWLVNPLYGTNDRMSEVYDRLMFHGATFADLQHRGLPVVSVNGTDIANGVSFPFTQGTFDLICSDLTRFPVSRAVAASNGFPVVFSPITLTSFRRDCKGTWPPEVSPPPAGSDESRAELSRRAQIERIAHRYLDPERTSYVHVMDGGIADNLALRGLLNALLTIDDKSALFRTIAHQTRRVLVVSIDGQAATDPTLGQQRMVTGLATIFSAVSGTQIDAYNFETLLLADQEVTRLVKRIRVARCTEAPAIDGHRCDDVQGGLVHLSLDSVTDPEQRRRLQAIRTGLTIPDADVDTLVSWGERLVVENPKIRALTSGLDDPGAAPPSVSEPAAGHERTARR